MYYHDAVVKILDELDDLINECQVKMFRSKSTGHLKIKLDHPSGYSCESKPYLTRIEAFAEAALKLHFQLQSKEKIKTAISEYQKQAKNTIISLTKSLGMA